MICSAGWPTATSKCALTPFAETVGFSSASQPRWWRREFSITASVSTSSPISGGRQTVITKSSAPCVAASSSAVSNAFFPDGDPSYATRILLYTNQLRGVSCAEGLPGMTRSDSSVFGSRWRGGNQSRILRLGDDAVRQAEQRGNGAERKAGRHQECRIHSLLRRRPECPRYGIDPYKLGHHLDGEHEEKRAGRGD